MMIEDLLLTRGRAAMTTTEAHQPTAVRTRIEAPSPPTEAVPLVRMRVLAPLMGAHRIEVVRPMEIEVVVHPTEVEAPLTEAADPGNWHSSETLRLGRPASERS